jgi:hypothetical protein
VTNGNLNAVAVVQLTGADKGDQVVGLIPTGWYPNSVSFGPTVNSVNGNWVYVVNGKSPTGPNTGMCYSAAPPNIDANCVSSQEYNPQRVKAGFQSFPQPTAAQLSTLTAQVAINDHFAATESESDAAVMAAVRGGIQHVIYIIKAAHRSVRPHRTHAHTHGGVLGAGHPGHGLHLGRPHGLCAIQPRSMEGADGQQTVSRHADRQGPAAESRATAGALPAAFEAECGEVTSADRGFYFVSMSFPQDAEAQRGDVAPVDVGVRMEDVRPPVPGVLEVLYAGISNLSGVPNSDR